MDNVTESEEQKSVIEVDTPGSEDGDNDSSKEEEEEEGTKAVKKVSVAEKRKKQDESSSDEESPTPKKKEDTPTTLFIGNLSYDCDEDILTLFFTDSGFKPKSVRLITSDGRSKGFGYADFSSVKIANKAIVALNNEELCGRNVRLEVSNRTPGSAPRGGGGSSRGTPRGGRGGRGGGGGRGCGPPSKTLMVFNLNFETEPYTLQDIFEEANDVYLPKNRETGEKRGFGFIRFDDVDSAAKALKKLNYSEVDGQEIELRYAEERGDTPGRGRGGGRGRGRGRGGSW